MNRDQVRHSNEGQVDRRPAGGAESVDLVVPAISSNVPIRRLAGDPHVGTLRKRQIGSVPGAASFLAIATLAVVLEMGSLLAS